MTLDLLYVLGSLWSGGAGPQVCAMRPDGPDLRSQPALMVSSAGRSDAGAVAAVTAFVDVHVIPMDTERVLAHQTVLVAGGRITALGPTDQVPVPAGAARIDGRGKFLIPGLTDMHFHTQYLREADILGRAQRHWFNKLARGITASRHLAEGTSKSATIRQPGGINATPSQMRRWVETGDVPMPRIYPSPVIPKSLPPDSAAAYVAAAKAVGYRHITIPFGYSTWPGDEPRARHERAMIDSLMAAARRVGLPVASHSHKLPFETVLALGATGGSTEHVYMYWDPLGFPFGAPLDSNVKVSPSKLQALVAATKRAGLWVTPTLRCSAYVVYKTPAQLQLLQHTVKALHDAGVGLLLSEDNNQDVNQELEALVDAGLSPYQALVTGTRNPAQWLGLLDSSGTVAVGKWADLVLLRANPLADVRHVREPAGVMVAGRWLDRAALDQHQAASGRRRRTP